MYIFSKNMFRLGAQSTLRKKMATAGVQSARGYVSRHFGHVTSVFLTSVVVSFRTKFWWFLRSFSVPFSALSRSKGWTR